MTQVTILYTSFLSNLFLNDRPWISPWIKFNEFEPLQRAGATMASRHVMHLWRHQQSIATSLPERIQDEKDTAPMCEDRLFIAIYSFITPCKCKKWNNACTVVTKCLYAHSRVIWCLPPLCLRNSGNKHKKWPTCENINSSLGWYIHYQIFISRSLLVVVRVINCVRI